MKGILRNKKGAMEMSVGTIVTIVILMSVLILGLILVRNIFVGSTRVVDMTNQQLEDEVKKLFSDSSELVIVPSSREVEIVPGETEAFGIGIQNLGGVESNKFSYRVSAASVGADCGNQVSLDDIEKWINLGKEEEDITIRPAGLVSRKVQIAVPVGAPLCSVRYKVEVNEGNYAGDYVDIKIVAN